MNLYEKKILGALLDSYEKSLLSRGENRVAVHISFPFTKDAMPKYFDVSSPEYDEIHGVLHHLEGLGLIRIVWKNGHEDHIVQKVLLRDENVDAVYRYAKRTPRSELEMNMLKLLDDMQEECRTPAAASLAARMRERVLEGKSIKEYGELSDTERIGRILRAVSAVEENDVSCYIREFSLRVFKDSKIFESLLGPVGKAMRRFNPAFEDMDIYAILSEYGIYHTPNYVYLKGEGTFSVEGEDESRLCPGWMRQGLGLAGDDIGRLRLADASRIRKVITIENLTTYFRWDEPESVIIYLGGYHNSVRRDLLCMLFEQLPDTEWFHFGDIDVNGFLIFEDLKNKTGIPFQTYHMGVDELREYGMYAKPLTDNDRKRLMRMMQDGDAALTKGHREVFEYMLRHGIKLEQECIVR